MFKIIIIEDIEIIRNELSIFLTNYGYQIYAPEHFQNIVEVILGEKADLVLLDINLPYEDGYHVCREVRKVSDVPIIVVTSRNTDMDEIMSMNIGADDFITKPYNTQVLEARISSLLRRSKGNQSIDTLEYEGMKLNLTNGTITYDKNTLDLTKNELKMLCCLIKNRGKIVSRDDLMEFLWNSGAYIDDNNLSVNVTRLRKKLVQLGFTNTIETRRGMGYLLP